MDEPRPPTRTFSFYASFYPLHGQTFESPKALGEALMKLYVENKIAPWPTGMGPKYLCEVAAENGWLKTEGNQVTVTLSKPCPECSEAVVTCSCGEWDCGLASHLRDECGKDNNYKRARDLLEEIETSWFLCRGLGSKPQILRIIKLALDEAEQRGIKGTK